MLTHALLLLGAAEPTTVTAAAPRVALLSIGASEAERELMRTQLESAGLQPKLVDPEALTPGAALEPLLAARGTVARGRDEARRLFFEAQYPAAKKKAQAAAAEAAGWEGDPAIVRDLALLEVVAAQAGDAQAWARAAALNPSLDLELTQWSPDVRQRFARERAALEKLPQGALSIETTPPGAIVFVDGAAAGRSPLTVRAAVGPHAVLTLLDGHLPVSRRMPVSAGATTGVALTLAKATGDERLGVLRLELELRAELTPEAVAAAAALLESDAVMILDGSSAEVHLIAGGAGVKTETFTERGPRLAALRAAIDAGAKHVRAACLLAHTAPASAVSGAPLELAIAAGPCLARLQIHYREVGAPSWSTLEAELEPRRQGFGLPALRSGFEPWVLEYYVAAFTHAGARAAAVASALTPLRVPVTADQAAPAPPIYKRAWFWGVLGVLVAGGAAAVLGVVLAPSPGSNVNL